MKHFKKPCLSQGKPGSSKLSVKFKNFDFPESGQAILFKINYNFKKVTPYKKSKACAGPGKYFFIFTIPRARSSRFSKLARTSPVNSTFSK